MKKIRRKEMIMFFEKLGLYTGSGLSVNASLGLIANDHNGKTKVLYTDMIHTIESGHGLSLSLSSAIKLPEAVSGLLHAGELSGRISESINISKNLMEKQEELKGKCISAIIYPVVIGVFAILLTIGLFKGIMPQIIPLLQSLKVPLPLLTRIVISLSRILSDYGLYILLISTLIIIFAPILNAKSRRVKILVSAIVLRSPIIGKVVSDYMVSLFLRSCGSMINSGIDVERAMRYASASLGHSRNIGQSIKAFIGGSTLGAVLKDIKYIPAFVASLVSAGEVSGHLGHSLIKSADIIDADIDRALRKITSLLEPAMMIMMGGMVGAIALSIMMPIYDVSKVLQH